MNDKYQEIVNKYTPKEDRIFVDSASDRRLFFDHLNASFDPAHIGRLSRLNKLLSERASIIKNTMDVKWLDALDEQIAATSDRRAARHDVGRRRRRPLDATLCHHLA